MYTILDENGNYTGHDYQNYSDALDALEHCPENWYITQIHK